MGNWCKAVCLIGLTNAMLLADEELAPYPYVTVAEGGRYYFKMIPEGGSGRAYRVSEGSSDTLLWSISGWYASSTFLSWDGVYLVRIGDWPRGQSPSFRDLAIAFYRQDRLIKSYSTADLILDPARVEVSKSHYQFRKGIPGFKEVNGYEFQLITVEDLEYLFDIRSGSILARTPCK